VQQDSSNPVTALLIRWREGDRQALDALMPLVYSELRRLAQYYLQRERADHTLQSTALVHEAYLRLAGNDPPQWQNRAHFWDCRSSCGSSEWICAAGCCQARSNSRLTLDNALGYPCRRHRLDRPGQGLDRTLEMDEQQGRIVELRFFAGLTIEDTSDVLGISPATVKRDWTTARAWLHRAITGEASA
jgi:DNA-directed RNA polymerase specialized sigma24 family protein